MTKALCNERHKWVTVFPVIISVMLFIGGGVVGFAVNQSSAAITKAQEVHSEASNISTKLDSLKEAQSEMKVDLRDIKRQIERLSTGKMTARDNQG